MGRSMGFDGVFMGPRWDFYGTFYEWGGVYATCVECLRT